MIFTIFYYVLDATVEYDKAVIVTSNTSITVTVRLAILLLMIIMETRVSSSTEMFQVKLGIALTPTITLG